MLRIEHISKTFHPGTVNEKKALDDFSLTVNDGDFVTIIGSNGAGKSTLFNSIAGNFLVDSGRILTGMGGPGYKIKDEFGEGLKHDDEGILSMANAGPNTGGSQFFITLAPLAERPPCNLWQGC